MQSGNPFTGRIDERTGRVAVYGPDNQFTQAHPVDARVMLQRGWSLTPLKAAPVAAKTEVKQVAVEPEPEPVQAQAQAESVEGVEAEGYINLATMNKQQIIDYVNGLVDQGVEAASLIDLNQSVRALRDDAALKELIAACEVV
jgi:hypothetical protein